jgi:hypothetical protein
LESVIGNPVLHLYEETDREREKERLLEWKGNFSGLWDWHSDIRAQQEDIVSKHMMPMCKVALQMTSQYLSGVFGHTLQCDFVINMVYKLKI